MTAILKNKAYFESLSLEKLANECALLSLFTANISIIALLEVVAETLRYIEESQEASDPWWNS